MRSGVPAFLAAATTSATLSGPPMLPGLMRTAATPASIALSASEELKWMSATTGSGERRTISGSASASGRPGTAQRTISQPAAASASIWAIVASTLARRRRVVIDCTATGAPPPILTPPIDICRWLATRAIVDTRCMPTSVPTRPPRRLSAKRAHFRLFPALALQVVGHRPFSRHEKTSPSGHFPVATPCSAKKVSDSGCVKENLWRKSDSFSPAPGQLPELEMVDVVGKAEHEQEQHEGDPDHRDALVDLARRPRGRELARSARRRRDRRRAAAAAAG